MIVVPDIAPPKTQSRNRSWTGAALAGRFVFGIVMACWERFCRRYPRICDSMSA